MRHSVAAVILFSAVVASRASAQVTIKTARVPGGGVQPQVAVDSSTGRVHLICLQGEAGAADVMYYRSDDGGDSWSPAVRVNSQPGSAIATGTVRGAQIALGREGRVHVAWNGSKNAEPKAQGSTPVLYSRLGDDGKTFEPQRNVVTQYIGLDGGCSIATDNLGGVFIAWHAPPKPGAGEENRALWIAQSKDDGKTFAAERKWSSADEGACGCCGTKMLFAGDKVWTIYRSAHGGRSLRDVRITSGDARPDAPASDKLLADHRSAMCPMSTFALLATPAGPIAAWEKDQTISWARIDAATGAAADVHTLPGGGRKHPALAMNKDGVLLVAWAEGTGWNRGGKLAWQAFDAKGQPIQAASGSAAGVPVWGLPAAIARKDGSFLIVY